MTIKDCDFNGFFILTNENPVYLSVPQFTLEISTSIHIISLSLNFYISGQEQDIFPETFTKIYVTRQFKSFKKILFPSDIANNSWIPSPRIYAI